MHSRICALQIECEDALARLKLTSCPHCKTVGTLNRHGFLRGYEQGNHRHTVVRAQRVFCSNRYSARGCGRTFSLWITNRVKRLFLDAPDLWDFLLQVAETGNKFKAFETLRSSMSESAPYRIWKRFLSAQAAIRTALFTICPPPRGVESTKIPSESAGGTIAHLKEAFKSHALDPVSAFQVRFQSFFM